MNNAVHQLTKLILEAMAWVLNTAASLWVWSWTQIAALFGMAWGDLPGWKLAVGIAVLRRAGRHSRHRGDTRLGRARPHRRRVLDDGLDAVHAACLRHRRRTVLARIPVGGRQRMTPAPGFV